MSKEYGAIAEKQPLNGLDPNSNSNGETLLCNGTYILETSKEKRRRQRSLWIMYFSTLLQSIGGSIVITGIWPYLQQLDADVKTEWLGWVVAANPLGQLISSPIIGWWCNKIESVRVPSIFCLILFTISSCWYGILPLHDKGAVWFICVARFLVGISSGSITACRTFITQGTLVSERTKAISHLSLSQALGFVLGPVGQLVLKPLGSDGIVIVEDRLTLNMYTAVGWLTACLGLINLILFHPRLFYECDIAAREAQMKAKLEQSKKGFVSSTSSQANNRWTTIPPDYIGLSVIIITFFIVFFNFVLLETLGTPVSIEQFGWSHETAITNVGLTMIISSVVCTSIFFLIPYLAKRVDERVLLIGGGIIPTIVGRLFFFPYFGDSPRMREFGCVDEHGRVLVYIKSQEDCRKPYSWNVIQHGCPESQKWCFEMPALNPIVVACGYAFCTLGFPFCIALSQTIFSKMIGPRPQGVWMGALTSISSLSRVIGPIFVTFIYTKYGTIVTSGTATGLMILCLVLLGSVYRRLIPLVTANNDSTIINSSS